MIMRTDCPLTFSPGPGPYQHRGSITWVERALCEPARATVRSTPEAACLCMSRRRNALLFPRVLDSAEAPGGVSRDHGHWLRIHSNDMLAAALAASGMVWFLAALSDTAAALRQSRTLTVSLVGEVSRGTPVYPPGLGYGSGPEGAPVRAEAPGSPSAYRPPDPGL